MKICSTWIRKFLKHVGFTSQRAIETAVHEALQSGKLKGKKSVSARVTLTIDGLDLKHEITDDITLERRSGAPTVLFVQ